MFQTAGWILLITILTLNPQYTTTPIEIKGFKTEESCLKAGEKAKQDITGQVIKHYAKYKEEDPDEQYGALYIPIVICLKKD